jgi:choline dehydrogenase
MLGGSSARNTLVYHRGTRSSYQKWADLVGDEGYTFENLLPYFQKSLNFTPPNNDLRLSNATPDYDDSALGTGDGPLRLSFSNWAYAFGTWATKAFSEIGISIRKEGFQNGGLLGQAYSMSTQDGVTMLRSSSETAFLRRSLGDTEFYVYPLTLARKVLFERKSQTTGKMAATGVLVETSGAQYRISAKKEVIISAGVFGSPKLLQISGIGPSALLEGLDIPVVVDLPGVGQNMQDQVYVSISHSINAITASSLGDPLFLSQQTRLFNDEGAGLLASTGLDIIAWEKLPRGPSSCLDNETTQYLDTFPDDWPEVEYLAFSAYFGDVSLPVTADTHGGTQYASVGVALAASRSIGSVNITSADASVAPSIDPRYFAEKADMDVAVAGFKRARQFWASNSLRGFVASNEAYPGSSVGDDYESIQASIRQSFMTAYHGSCTCAMGKPSDPRAVVDTQARVFNVDGLRVVDASIFPLLPPGHPQATVCKYTILIKFIQATCAPCFISVTNPFRHRCFG